jgi:AraC-like DNA-binding protein
MYFEKLLDAECHLICPCYRKKSDSIFEIFDFAENEVVSINSRLVAFTFVIEGEILFKFNKKTTHKAAEGEFFIIPSYGIFSLQAVKPGKILCIYMRKEIDLCRRIREEILDKKQPKTKYGITTLPMNKFIRRAIDNFIDSVGEKLLCRNFLNSIVEEIITYICVFYPIDALKKLLAPILDKGSTYRMSRDLCFRQKIIQNSNRAFTAKELAKLVNMSERSFSYHFKHIFDMPPKEWIQQERKKIIYSELTTGNKPIKIIASETGFQYEQEFYKYCQKMFGMTASKLRENNRI